MKKAKVTAEMIAEGIKGSDNKCPIGLCMKEEFPNAKRIIVDIFEGKDTEILIDMKPLIVENSDKVREFIVRFDNGKPVKPFWITYQKP